MATIKDISTKANKSGNYVVTMDDEEIQLVSENDIEDMRAEFEKEHGRKVRLTTKDLIGIAIECEGKSLPEVIETMKSKEPEAKEGELSGERSIKIKDTDPKSAQDRDPLAIAIGKKIAGNADTVKDLEEIVTFKEELKRLPASIPFHLQSVLTKDDLAIAPEPKSVKPEGYKGNRLFEYADKKPGTESWFLGVAENLPQYPERIGKPIAGLQAAMDKTNPEQNEWSKNSRHLNEAYLNKFRTRRSNLVSAIRDSFALLRKMDDVKQKTSLSVSFVTITENGKKVIDHTTMPMRIVHVDKTLPEDDINRFREKVMSVGSFMKVDVEAVAQQPDHFAAFASKRGAGTKQEVLAIDSAQAFFRVVSALAVSSGQRDLMTQIYKVLDKPREESDSYLSLIFAAQPIFDAITSRPKYAKRMELIEQEADRNEEERIEQARKKVLGEGDKPDVQAELKKALKEHEEQAA